MKKIKFPLLLKDDVQVRTLSELQEHFDFAKLMVYYHNGQLLTWLNDRYYEELSAQIAALDVGTSDFSRRFCELLGVESNEQSEIDFVALANRHQRLQRLQELTSDETLFEKVDRVAFDQEELADLLDEGTTEIVLAGERFSVPLSRKNVSYIGVNRPVVTIHSKTVVDFAGKHIQFTNVQFDATYQKVIDDSQPKLNEKSMLSFHTYRPSSFLDVLLIKDQDRKGAEQRFEILASHFSDFDMDLDLRTANHMNILKDANLNHVFETFLNKIN